MKLKTYLRKMDPNKIVYIGSGNAFIFIGKPEEFLKDANKFDRQLIDYNDDQLKRLKSGLKKCIETPPISRSKQARAKWKTNCQKLEKTIAKRENIALNYIQLLERTIIDVYSHPDTDYEGTMIIIEGNEGGRFWTKAEYDLSVKGIMPKESDEEEESKIIPDEEQYQYTEKLIDVQFYR